MEGGGGGKRFEKLISLLADGIIVVDTDGVMRFMNPAAEALLGRSFDDSMGEHFGFPIGREISELNILRSDGPRVVEMRVAAGEWEGEDAYLAVLTDVTDRKRAQEQQHQAMQRLRELDNLKNEFVAMVSHDLRNPLSAISGTAETLEQSWDELDADRRTSLLGRISKRAMLLADLVDGILQVSAIESGELKYEIQPFDVGKLVVGASEETASEGDRARIKVSIPQELPSAVGDETRTWQVVTNLLSNALKFSPSDRPVEVSVVSDDPFVRVSVRDHGPGIPTDELPQLFQKFSRLAQPGGARTPGSGLGLYFCKAMVEAQGGSIWVESEPGKGATFCFTLPTVARSG